MRNLKDTLAFDVYGTLIDTSGVFATLEKMIGVQAEDFMGSWRSKQLEYSFRRGMMHQYVDFSKCTKDALEFCVRSYQVDFSTEQKDELLQIYRVLPAFPDVEECLQVVKNAGYRTFAFSNGSHAAVSQLLTNAKLLNYFEGVVSVENTAMFKPSPLVYAHFNKTSQSSASDSWLISGNTFDVVGAMAYGMNSVWVRRSENTIFDVGWEQPTATVPSLADLITVLEQT